MSTPLPDNARPLRSLKVGGVAPFSSADYPGKLAAVVFVQGCPWQCAYCHNPHLQPRTETGSMPWADVFALLQRRRGLLDAVVFSGGEPTLDPALPTAIHDARSLGFQIALHTGGAYPARLEAVLPLVDWIGLDIKAPFADYEKITGVKHSSDPARTSLEMILASGKPFECRTTVHPDLISENDLLQLAQTLSAMGVTHYALQMFRSHGCQNKTLTNVRQPFPVEPMLPQLKGLFQQLTVRSA